MAHAVHHPHHHALGIGDHHMAGDEHHIEVHANMLPVQNSPESEASNTMPAKIKIEKSKSLTLDGDAPDRTPENLKLQKSKSVFLEEDLDKSLEALNASKQLSPADEQKLLNIVSERHDLFLQVDGNWSWIRIKLAKCLVHTKFEAAMGLVILSQLFCAIRETDMQAIGDEEQIKQMKRIMLGYTYLYTAELSLRLYVFRLKLFESHANLLDLTVVGVDIVFELLGGLIGHVPSLAALRVFRLVRLVRALRVLTTFRELYIMLHSFVGAMKAMVWTTLMVFVVLTICSMVAVEILHPLNVEIASTGVYEGCARCERAYESVMQANLTFFQQIIAGDSWGVVTINILETHPWTAIIYFPTFIMVGMGLMNLVLTVIVDRAETAREATEQEALRLKLKAIKVIFSGMDDDASGCVSLHEFAEGLESGSEFSKALAMLDISTEDLRTVYEMMDGDKSGTVSYDEFVENLFKMKNDSQYTILLFVKHIIGKLEDKIMNQEHNLEVKMNKVLAEEHDIEEKMKHMAEDVQHVEENLATATTSNQNPIIVSSQDTALPSWPDRPRSTPQFNTRSDIEKTSKITTELPPASTTTEAKAARTYSIGDASEPLEGVGRDLAILHASLAQIMKELTREVIHKIDRSGGANSHLQAWDRSNSQNQWALQQVSATRVNPQHSTWPMRSCCDTSKAPAQVVDRPAGPVQLVARPEATAPVAS